MNALVVESSCQALLQFLLVQAPLRQGPQRPAELQSGSMGPAGCQTGRSECLPVAVLLIAHLGIYLTTTKNLFNKKMKMFWITQLLVIA